MKLLKVCAAFTLTALILISPCAALASEAADIDVKASSAMLLEAETGRVLYEKEPDKQVYPASITKIMTVLLALENCDPDVIVTVSNSALLNLNPDGTSAELIAGEQMPLLDLLYCAMVSSANDACNVIAEHVSGSIDEFVTLMNQRAGELGCSGTHYANPHGLHDENHYTTAQDTYRIVAEALKNPLFLELSNTASKEIAATNKSDTRYLISTNYLLSNKKSVDYIYPYAHGIKTGHTTPAGFCLVSIADKNDITLLGIVFGASSVVREDGTTQIQSFSETIRLLNWGFENFERASILKSSVPVMEIPVNLAAGSGVVVLQPEKSIEALFPKGYDLDSLESDTVIYNEDELVAPIVQGEILGEITYIADGIKVGTVNLIAVYAVEMSRLDYYSQTLRGILGKTWVRVLIAAIAAAIVIYTVIVVINHINGKSKTPLGGTYKGSSRKKQ